MGAFLAVGLCGPTIGVAIGRLFFLPRLLRLHLQQPLPVGNRNLIIVRVDLVEGEEPVPVTAIFHECRLEAGFHPDHLGQVDVALELALGCCFYVEIFKPVTIQHHDAGFFRVAGIDQHTFGHVVVNSGTPPRPGAPGPGRSPAGGGIGLLKWGGPCATEQRQPRPDAERNNVAPFVRACSWLALCGSSQTHQSGVVTPVA